MRVRVCASSNTRLLSDVNRAVIGLHAALVRLAVAQCLFFNTTFHLVGASLMTSVLYINTLAPH